MQIRYWYFRSYSSLLFFKNSVCESRGSKGAADCLTDLFYYWFSGAFLISVILELITKMVFLKDSYFVKKKKLFRILRELKMLTRRLLRDSEDSCKREPLPIKTQKKATSRLITMNFLKVISASFSSSNEFSGKMHVSNSCWRRIDVIL